MKKILFVLALFLMLSCANAAKKIQLTVEDDGIDPVTPEEDADTKDKAYLVVGPGPYTLTVKIQNLQEIEEFGGPVDVMALFDASYSFNDEIEVVKNDIEKLGAELDQNCQKIGIPGCFNLGLYVFEGGTCARNCSNQYVCTQINCRIVTVKDWCTECTVITIPGKCQVCDYETECREVCELRDNVKVCWPECHEVPKNCRMEPCDTYKWDCKLVPCFVEEEVCDEHCEWQEVCGWTVCKRPDAAFWNSTDFQQPVTPPLPLDYANDVGLLPITNNMTLVKNNLEKISAPNFSTQQLEPWGSIITYVLNAPEVKWQENHRRAIILITDEKDDSGTYKTAAQLAKDQNVVVFGIIGKGVGSDEAKANAEYVANLTGGKVFTYTNSEEIKALLREIMGSLIKEDTFVFSKELGPNWDGITANFDLPPVPRKGPGLVYPIKGLAPAVWPTTEEYFHYRVSLKSNPAVFDDAWVRVTINTPPTADFEMIPTPPTGMVPLSVKFVNKSTDNEGNITNYHWVFGDPSSGADNESNEENPTHVFQYAGEYSVTLTVTDSGQASHSVTKKVMAKERPLISAFKANNPKTPDEGLDITVYCTKFQALIKIEILDKDGLLVTKDKDGNPITNPIKIPGTNDWPRCGSTISPDIRLSSGVYQIRATIMKDDGSGPDPDCTNCPKSTHITVGMSAPEMQTPEIPAILTTIIALAVIVITNRKKK
ncbi:MAG: PKD domain-containing protein [Candidatus Diapherotrites archaeon]